MDRNRQGCLSGLLELFLLRTVLDWLQSRFGFGRGCSCTGLGCGVILLFLSLCFFCAIATGTDWLSIRF